MSDSGVLGRVFTSVTNSDAKVTFRSWLPPPQDEALLHELMLRQSSSSESRDNRSGQMSSENLSTVGLSMCCTVVRSTATSSLTLHGGNDGGSAATVPLIDTFFLGSSSLGCCVGGDLSVFRTRMIASCSILMVMVLLCFCLLLCNFYGRRYR